MLPKLTHRIVLVVVLAGLGTYAAAQRIELAVPPLVAARTVRTFFDAFKRQDARALTTMTEGQAAAKALQALDRIRLEARRHDVGVELRLAELAVAPQAPAGATTPVEARFNIDVIARKWIFSKVARQLRGRATFYIGSNLARSDMSAAKIVGIKLDID